MKKSIMIFIITFSFSVIVSAQRISFGIKGGCNVSISTTFDYPIAGVLAGGYVNYLINDYSSVQGELLFSMQGGKTKAYDQQLYESSGVISLSKITGRLNYINIPLLYSFKPARKVPFNILIGPQFGYCIYRDYGGQDLKDFLITTRAEGITDVKTRNFDIALSFGVEYTFIKHLVLGLRYNLGLLDTQSFSFGYGIESKADKNRVLDLSVGWTF